MLAMIVAIAVMKSNSMILKRYNIEITEQISTEMKCVV